MFRFHGQTDALHGMKWNASSARFSCLLRSHSNFMFRFQITYRFTHTAFTYGGRIALKYLAPRAGWCSNG